MKTLNSNQREKHLSLAHTNIETRTKHDLPLELKHSRAKHRTEGVRGRLARAARPGKLRRIVFRHQRKLKGNVTYDLAISCK